MSNLRNNKFLDLLAELNPLHQLDPYRQPLNLHIMNSDTSKPTMEKVHNTKEGTKQVIKRTDNNTPQPPANKATNPIQNLFDITETLNITKPKPTPNLSPADAAEWEEVFKPDLGSDGGSDEWEMIDERDAKPCVVPAKKLLEKRKKKVESLEKHGWWWFRIFL